MILFRKKRVYACALALLFTFGVILPCRQNLLATEKAISPFVVSPYVQLGDHSRLMEKECLELMWMSRDKEGAWLVEFKPLHDNGKAGMWYPTKEVKTRLIGYAGINPLFVHSTTVENLKPGAEFKYRIWYQGKQVFIAVATARKPYDKPFRFAVFGDTGAGTDAQKTIAFQCCNAKPDLVVIPGDIVYSFGRLSEYLQKFFPVFNSDYLSKKQGAPLIRSTLFVAAAGNHDMGLVKGNIMGDFGMFSDMMAYFLVWSQPLNGPIRNADAANAPRLQGDLDRRLLFMQTAGKRFPAMGNFSFDYGNSHWTVLDANFYVNWSDPQLRQWVENDISTSKALWKFVCFHQPGFSADPVHSNEQRMRLLADIFQKTGVSVVFCGHAHNYQRSYPFSFKANCDSESKKVKSYDGTVDGEFYIDYKFDGDRQCNPKGVIYIVTGAGGASLYSLAKLDQTDFTKRFSWLAKHNGETHSLTICDVRNDELSLRQIGENGSVIDKIRIIRTNKSR